MSKKNLTVTVARVERGPRSPMGNPSFVFHTDAGVFMTRKDAQCGYVVDNDFPVDEKISREVTLELNGHNRITGWQLS